MASTKVSVLYQLAESMRTEWVLACATAWGESTAPAEESPTLVPSLVLPWSPRGRVRVRVLSSAQSHAEGSETWEDGSLRLLKGSKRKAHAQISVPLKGGSSHFAVEGLLQWVHTQVCAGEMPCPPVPAALTGSSALGLGQTLQPCFLRGAFTGMPFQATLLCAVLCLVK